jgi:dihydroxyacetone kinase
MKKFMNSPATMLRESLAGFAQCHRDIVALDDDCRFVRRRQLKPGKVALVSGGGSGHEPLHTGFVGHGMLDAACPGRSSRRRRRTRCSPQPKRSTAAPGCCSSSRTTPAT